MRLLQLYYFKVLAEKEHLKNASAELCVSAPSLSTTIKRLEEELGVELFNRIGRNIQLNENGKKFYRHVKSIFNELEVAKNELVPADLSGKKVINIATSTHVIWEDPIIEFMHKYPEIQVNQTMFHLDKLRDEALMSQHDIIITALSDLTLNNYEHSVFFPYDKPMLGVYEGHRFFNRKEISLIEAKNERFLALNKGFSSRAYFEYMCDLAGFVPNIVSESDYLLRGRLARNKMGIVFTTLLASRSKNLHDLHFVEIVEPISPRLQTIFWKRGLQLSPHVQLFKDFMVNYYEEKWKEGAYNFL